MKFTLIVFMLIPFYSLATIIKEQATSIDPTSLELKWGPCPAIFPKTCELTVLHGDPAKPNADLLLRVPNGTLLVAHTHTSAERMILLTGKMEVKYQGQNKILLKKGDYAFGPSKLPHEASCLEGQCVLFIAFEEPVDAKVFSGSLN